MNELENTVTSNGTYENVPISLTSNTSVVKILDGLTLTIETDKAYWKDGYLNYTITLKNETDNPYTALVLSDTLDTSLIELVDGTLMIDGAYAQSSEYTYTSPTLTINLDEVEAQGEKIVKFSVKKKEMTSLS